MGRNERRVDGKRKLGERGGRPWNGITDTVVLRHEVASWKEDVVGSVWVRAGPMPENMCAGSHPRLISVDLVPPHLSWE